MLTISPLILIVTFEDGYVDETASMRRLKRLEEIHGEIVSMETAPESYCGCCELRPLPGNDKLSPVEMP